MFYTFDKFWQTAASLGLAWISYAIFGFEFCTLTLLTLILLQKHNNKT